MIFFEQGPIGPEVKQLALPAAVRQQIGSEASQASPEECCGLLLGYAEETEAVVLACAASPNLAPDRLTGFEIDPALLLAIQRRARAKGEAVLGHYHSHPHGPAAPSGMDRARAWTPGHVWLICAPGGEDWDYSAHLAVEEKSRIVLRPLPIIDS